MQYILGLIIFIKLVNSIWETLGELQCLSEIEFVPGLSQVSLGQSRPSKILNADTHVMKTHDRRLHEFRDRRKFKLFMAQMHTASIKYSLS